MMGLENLPDKAQKGLMLLSLIERGLVNADNVLKYSQLPFYILKPNEQFEKDFDNFYKIMNYLIKSKYVLPFSFSDDTLNSNGFKPVYFLLSEDYPNIDVREKELIQLINLEKDLNYLFN